MGLPPLARDPTPYNRSGVIAAKQPDGTFIVRYVILGSGAAAAGVHKADVITAIDGASAKQFSGADFVTANALPQRRTIALTIVRDGRKRVVAVRMRTLI